MQNTLSDDVTRFVNRIEETGTDPAPVSDAADPQVVFQGALVLNREQEDRMIDRAMQRMAEIESDQGRDRATMNDSSYGAAATLQDLDTFLGRRRLFEMMYHKRVEWRRHALGGIFADHNLHLPIIRRIVQQQIARASNYFFSTEPWFSASPQGAADEMTADRYNRYAQWKFRKAKVRKTFESAIEKAFIRGESIVKTSSVRDSRFYEDILNVAIDPATGEPVLAADGDYIQETDTLTAAVREEPGEPGPNGEPAEPVMVPEVDPKTGEPIMVLARDPRTQIPAGGLTFDTRRVIRERVNYAGPEAKLVYYLDFLCPEEAESIQKADLVAHLYDMPAVTLAQAYMNRDGNPDDPERPRILQLLREAGGAHGTDAPAMASGHRVEDGERRDTRRTDPGSDEGQISVAEIYMRMDVNDDGRQEEVTLFLDRANRKPIFYDYTDRVTPKGLRPFHAVRVNPVDGRWYGSAQVDLFWDLQMFIDLTINRWNLSQSSSSRIDFWNPAAVYEGDADPHLRMNTGSNYRLKPGFTADDALQMKYLTDIKGSDLQSQLEFFLQVANTMSGVSNANDTNMAGLDTTKLATGIKHLEKSGQELFAPLLSHLEEGLSEASEQLLRLLAAGLDEPELYSFFEGAVRQLDEMKPAEIDGLDFIVEMELTRYKNEQELVQTLHALDLIDRFYGESPEKQQIIAPIYRTALKLFGQQHADQVILPGIWLPPGGAVPTDPHAAAAAVEPQPTGKSEELL